jgi:hypothetical protein
MKIKCCLSSGMLFYSKILIYCQEKTECKVWWYHSSLVFIQLFLILYSTSPPPLCIFKNANSIISWSRRYLMRKNMFPVVSCRNCCSLLDLRYSSTIGLNEDTTPPKICWSSQRLTVYDYLYYEISGCLVIKRLYITASKLFFKLSIFISFIWQTFNARCINFFVSVANQIISGS